MKKKWQKIKNELEWVGVLEMSNNDFFEVLKARLFLLKENCWTVIRYWWHPRFAKRDIQLLMRYFWKSPYRIARECTGEPYGETPLSMMDTIAKKAGITASDVVYELGCGRGRACFWLASFIGCKVVGIEYVPKLVEKAKKIHCPLVTFLCEDYLEADLSEATVIYLYGTLLSDATVRKIAEKFRGLKKGTKIVTISYPLTDGFHLVKKFDVQFPWGTTSCYIQEVG